MGSEPEPEPSPTPKLSLFSLPTQPAEPPGTVTPPLRTNASVPFEWEEVPGKPRACASAASPPPKPKAVRSLDLPPRLQSETFTAKITGTPSPTTVLDGPYSGRSVAQTVSFSFRKASERWNFGSWRWGSTSFKETGQEGGSSLDNSPAGSGCPSDQSDGSEVKITKVRKRSGFFSSSNKSHFWASIYEGVKHAVPWRRKREKLKKTDS
ncbi:uncharacterized protein At4g00950-like [Diospyros lotus]|uniref:uncharacterized protein At4g00950-like n=1 Tax=Diospyros lotus TaxID=55363 RepID=UPI00224E48E2|nr:uncharacterized protein At4g00950-like [Diospyros lotus]